MHTAHPATVHDGLWSPRRRALTVGLVLTITLVAFESLAVSTILPIVSRDLGDIELYGWVFSAFFLGSLLGIVVVGGVIDRGGLVRPFVAGLGLFALGLVIGGLAPSMPILVAGRFLQGLGAGAIPPTAYVAIGRSLPDSLRPRMFATLSTAWVLPGVIGPALSAAVAEHVHWRAVFLGLLPLIALAGAMTLPAIARVPAKPPGASDETDDGRTEGTNAIEGAKTTESDAATEAASERSVAADARRRLPQALLVATGAALVLAGLTSGTPIVLLGLVLLGLVLAVPAFRVLTPDGTLRAARGLPAAVLLRGVLTFAFFAADAYVPLALQGWRGTSAVVAGVVLTAATLAWTGGAWIQAHRIGRWGARRLIRSGFTLVALGIAGVALVLQPTIPVAVALVTWGVAGLGMGLAYAPLSLVVLREAAPGEEGIATSGLQLSDVLGTALGTGVGGAFIAAGERAGVDGWVGLALAFGVGATVAVAGSLVATRIRPGLSERAREPLPTPGT